MSQKTKKKEKFNSSADGGVYNTSDLTLTLSSPTCSAWIYLARSYQINPALGETADSERISPIIFSDQLSPAVWFYGISTMVGYLKPNPVYTYILDMYEFGLVSLFLMAYQLFLGLFNAKATLLEEQ